MHYLDPPIDWYPPPIDRESAFISGIRPSLHASAIRRDEVATVQCQAMAVMEATAFLSDVQAPC